MEDQKRATRFWLRVSFGWLLGNDGFLSEKTISFSFILLIFVLVGNFLENFQENIFRRVKVFSMFMKFEKTFIERV